MMKKLITVFCLMLAGESFASHPHDLICTLSTKTKTHESISMLFQIQSEREYVDGDPNKDIHDFTYQARICDDDNDLSASACSTFESLEPTHAANETFVLVSMKNKTDVFLTAKINNNILTGTIRSKDSAVEAITGKLTCISQTWVKLEAESDSYEY